VKRDCFYKVTVTTCVPDSINMFEDEEVYHWGYFPYSMVLKDVRQLYKDGADAVVLEMITQEQFDRRMEKYKDQRAWEEYQTNGIWNGEE
jgi:hypothetical protein